jgi:fatty acid desaturase
LRAEGASVRPREGRDVYHCATFYRTGFITRPLFFWDAGDCHIVHHIYPGILFYRMGRALRLIAPILKRHGARERRSFLELLHGFFIRVEPHHTLWSS